MLAAADVIRGSRGWPKGLGLKRPAQGLQDAGPRVKGSRGRTKGHGLKGPDQGLKRAKCSRGKKKHLI